MADPQQLQQMTSPFGQTFYVPGGLYGDPPPDPTAPQSIPTPPPAPLGLADATPAPDPSSMSPTDLAMWSLSQIGRGPAPAPSPAPAQKEYEIAPPGQVGATMKANQKVRQQQDAAVRARAADPFAQADDANAQALADQDMANKGIADTQSQIADQQYQARAGAMAEADKIDAERQQVAKQREQMRTQKESQITAYTKDVDSTKIDENAFWHDASTAKNVGRVIAMAMTGLGMALQNRGHEQNPVIAMFDAASQRSVQLQMDARDQKEKRLGRAQQGLDAFDRISDSKDARYSAEMARRYERGIQMGDLAAMQYGSKIAQDNWKVSRGLLEEKQAQYLSQAADKGFARDVQKQQLALQKQSNAIAGGHLSLARDQFKYGQQKDATDAAENKRRYDEGFAYQQQKDAEELNLKAAALDAKGDKKGSENFQKFHVAGVTNSDGSDFLADGTPESVAKLRDKKAAATTIVGLLDKALEIRSGWTSDSAKSAEWRKLQQLWGTARAKGKDALGLGALSGDDYKLLDSYLGTADPTEFRDPSAGILQARETILDDLNDSLHADGLDPKTRYDIPRIGANDPPAPVPADDAVRILETAPDRVLTNESGGTGGPGTSWRDPRTGEVDSSYYDGEPVSTQRDVLARLASAARLGSPTEAATAIATLRREVLHGENEGIRDRAKFLLATFGEVVR